MGDCDDVIICSLSSPKETSVGGDSDWHIPELTYKESNRTWVYYHMCVVFVFVCFCMREEEKEIER